MVLNEKITEIILKNIGNVREKFPLQIWKRYSYTFIDLLISNNFSSMTFLVIGRQNISLYDSPGP